jgi:hypothetical protein
VTYPAKKCARPIFTSINCSVIQVLLTAMELSEVIEATLLLAGKSSFRVDLARKSVSKRNYLGS